MKKILCAFLSLLMIISIFPFAIIAESNTDLILSNGVADREFGLRTETVRQNYALAREAAGEGMVLLENNGALPLDDGEAVTLFGVGQYNFVEGGTGSGANYTAYKPDLVDAMKAADEAGRIVLNTSLLDTYYSYYSEKLEAANINQYHAANQQAVNMEDLVLTSEDVLAARAVSDTAIYTISRIQGEGGDRSAVKGDYYISDIEAANLKLINDAGFEKFILVLNTSTAIDTSFIKNYAEIDAVLMAWLPGTEGAFAVADILVGDVNPSGKLTDTFAKSYDDYPSAESFLESNLYVNYSEDIFNGYRYFETFDPEYTKVNYEFGYGLSYTTFEISDESVKNDATTITVKATVTNTGSVSGKEVVQVYFSAPQGVLGKAARELAAYDKTKLLAPGESETLTMTFDINDMSAFDDLGKTGHKAAYVLEAGDYNIYIGNSVKNAGIRGIKGTYSIPELVVVEQLTSLASPTKLEKRLLADGTWEKLATAETNDDGSYKIDSSTKETVIEAENAQRYDNEITSGTLFGGEQNNLKYLTNITVGRSIEYDVTPDKAMLVSLTLAVSNPGEDITNPFTIYLNGTEIKTNSKIKNTCTLGEHVYNEISYAALELTDGKNTIKLTSNTDNALELDYIAFKSADVNIVDGNSEIVIQAEDFDNISEGYTGNFEEASNGSKNLSSLKNGKWVEYELFVTESGNYDLVLSYAATGDFSSPFTFSANGEEIEIDAYTLSKTTPAGATTTTEIYNTVKESSSIKVLLPQGLITFRVTAPGGAPNLDALIFKTPGTKISPDTDTRIEAESFTNIKDGYTGNLEDATNGTKNLTSFKNGNWTEYELYVTEAGIYDLVISYAATGDFISPFTFSANGEEIETASYNLPKTRPENASTTTEIYNTVKESKSIKVTLPQGFVTFRVTAPGNAPNLDALIFKTPGTKISPDTDTRIEAENFNNSIAGFTGNLEDASNGSKNVSSLKNGNWAEYELYVTEAGTYDIIISYASTGDFTSPYIFSANGEQLETNAYTLFKTRPENASTTTEIYNTVKESKSIKVTLPQGFVTFRVTAPGGAPNLDALIFKAPGTKISPDTDTRIEAENFNYIKSGYSGNFEDATNGTKNLTNFKNGNWTEYELYVTEAGIYNLVISYAATGDFISPFTFSANGEEIETDSYNLPKTRPENASTTTEIYNTVAESEPIEIILPKGFITFRVTAPGGAPNFDAFILTKVSDIEELPADNGLMYSESDIVLSFIDVYNGNITMDEFLASMKNIDLIKLAGGGPGTVSRSAASFGRLVEYEIPQITVSDGGAGLRLEPDIGATCLPCSTLLACTWNTELIREMGRVAGRDGMATNNDGWLAPGMNIHRNPLCGRNFEYFSEDPLVTGISGAMILLGARDEGVSAVPKHFTLNNKETGRGVSDSRISERAMREIYLEGFRIMFEMTDHKYLMSSYNKVNGVEVAESYDLLTGILRNEWGFDGIVMTDWSNDSNHLKEVKSGNNLKMPQGDINAFIDALENGDITRSELKVNAKSILNAVLTSNSMENAANYSVVSSTKSAVIHAKNFNFINDNHTGLNAEGEYIQAFNWNFIVTPTDKKDVYAPLTPGISSGDINYDDTRIFADYYINTLDGGDYVLDLLVYNTSGTGIIDVELDGELIASVKTKADERAVMHTEPLKMNLEPGNHKIRLSRNANSPINTIKLGRVIVSPYIADISGSASNLNGCITVIDYTPDMAAYACNCSASIILLENSNTKNILREFDTTPISNGSNTILNYSLSVDDGTYTLIVQKDGYTSAECEFTVSDGFAMIPMLTLKREDCTMSMECHECSRSERANESHSFELVYDNDSHWLECKHCSMTSGEKSTHELDGNGKCTLCMYDSNAVYSVTASSASGGKVSYNDNEPSESFTANIKVGSDITLTAHSNSGAPFIGWYDVNGAKISANISISFTVNADIELEAKFLPSYVIFTPENGLSGISASNNHIVATTVSQSGTLPSYINYNVPSAEKATDDSRFIISLDGGNYPEGYSSSSYPYMKICYRTSDYTNSTDINIVSDAGARLWGGTNFELNNNGSFNTVVYDLAKTPSGANNWIGGISFVDTAPLFKNNFTESNLTQIILRTAGAINSTLQVGNLDIAYIAFFASKEDAENFKPESDPFFGDVNNDGEVDPADVTYLVRHLANWRGYDSINEDNSDVNKSGNVNLIDSIILSRHIASWVGYEIIPMY